MGLSHFARQLTSLCSLQVFLLRLHGIDPWFDDVELTWAQSSEAKVLTFFWVSDLVFALL